MTDRDMGTGPVCKKKKRIPNETPRCTYNTIKSLDIQFAFAMCQQGLAWIYNLKLPGVDIFNERIFNIDGSDETQEYHRLYIDDDWFIVTGYSMNAVSY